MMTCRELTDFLSDYVAEELPSVVSREFEIHVRLCRDCKVFLAQFRETVAAGRGAVDDVPDVPIPEDLVRAIMQAVSATRPDH
jgi:anti-sigma factor RsiW